MEGRPDTRRLRVGSLFAGIGGFDHALGNALVPQIAEWIRRRIVEWEASGSQVS